MADIQDENVDLDFAEVVDASETVCNDDDRGTRHAYRCTVVQTSVGSVWERLVPDNKNCRKVFIAKDGDRDGVEQLQIFKNDGTLMVDQPVRNGTSQDFLFGNHRGVRVRIITKELGQKNNSSYYAHVEWYSGS